MLCAFLTLSPYSLGVVVMLSAQVQDTTLLCALDLRDTLVHAAVAGLHR
jgi:hypothetical protein